MPIPLLPHDLHPTAALQVRYRKQGLLGAIDMLCFSRMDVDTSFVRFLINSIAASVGTGLLHTSDPQMTAFWYRGPVTESGAHRHAAFQVAIGDDVAMVDATDTCHRGPVLIVPPMVQHTMLAATNVLTFFIDPHSTFADQLRSRCGKGITTAPELHGLTEEDIRAGTSPSTKLDPRLLQAMDTLANRQISMPDLAKEVGLSPQRLRALAQAQLGMPLTRWRIWQRLHRAAEALRAGESLSTAAATAGFADQAHLTRQMREMMGLTPAVIQPALTPTTNINRDRPADR